MQLRTGEVQMALTDYCFGHEGDSNSMRLCIPASMSDAICGLGSIHMCIPLQCESMQWDLPGSCCLEFCKLFMQMLMW